MRYVVSFVNSISDIYSDSIIAVMYAIYCYTGPCYNGTELYVVSKWLFEREVVGNSSDIIFTPCNICFTGHKLSLTIKHLEIHWCIIRAVTTDALVLEHQAICTHSAGFLFIVLDQFYFFSTYYFYNIKHQKLELQLENNNLVVKWLTFH